jgi:hypothetical protein
MSSLWTDLLFLHGHIANADLARRLANAPAPRSAPRGRRARQGATTPARQDAQPQMLMSPCGKACSPT